MYACLFNVLPTSEDNRTSRNVLNLNIDIMGIIGKDLSNSLNLSGAASVR